MNPDQDDVDWAMGELFHLIGQAKDLGTVAWHVDWEWFWTCMRVVYAQEPKEQQQLIQMLQESIGNRRAIFRFFAHAYARAN